MAMTTVAAVGRVGGVAVALGVGGAVAVGLAAQAAAAPADADASAARSAAAVGKASPSTAPRGAKTASPARRAVSTAPRAAARSRTSVVSLAAPLAPVAPTPSAAGTGVAATLTDAVRQIFGCDPRGRLITIYKGTHFAIPNSFGLFIQQVAGTGTFTANSAYDLGDEDQYDWNKFTGIAFTPLEPDRDSAMVGWRYNLTSQQFEIAPFYNVNKVRILPNERTEVISVPADQAFTFLVDYTGITLTYGDTTVYKPYPQGLVASLWTSARVSGWFGGNEVAPRTVSYFLKLN